MIIVDSEQKNSLVQFQVPLNAPKSPGSGKCFHGRKRTYRVCRVAKSKSLNTISEPEEQLKNISVVYKKSCLPNSNEKFSKT